MTILGEVPQLDLGVLLGLAIVHRKKEIITKKLSQSVPIFHVSLSFIYLFSQHYSCSSFSIFIRDFPVGKFSFKDTLKAYH